MKSLRILKAILPIIGMVLATVVLSKSCVEFAVLTWLFLVLTGVVIYFYHRHEGKGILAGLIATCLFVLVSLYLIPGSSMIAACFFGVLVALGGSIVIWFGGLVGMIISEIIRLLCRKMCPTK